MSEQRRVRGPNPGKSLEELRHDIAEQWHPSRNGRLQPADVTTGSSRAVGCPLRVGRKVSVVNSVVSIPEMAAQRHPTLNGGLRPEDVAAGTHQKVWWKCHKGPEHEWQAVGKSRKNGSGWPFCVIPGGYKTY